MKNVLSVSSLETDILSRTEIYVSNGGTGQDKQAQSPGKHSEDLEAHGANLTCGCEKSCGNFREYVKQRPLPPNS